jgi:hypothetical protein
MKIEIESHSHSPFYTFLFPLSSGLVEGHRLSVTLGLTQVEVHHICVGGDSLQQAVVKKKYSLREALLMTAIFRHNDFTSSISLPRLASRVGSPSGTKVN